MTVRLSRRDTLLRTAAVAAAGLIPGAAVPGLAAPLRTSPGGGEIDAILQARVDAADAPGVVAMAATGQSVIYQGAFGARSMGAAARMSADTVFSIASMTKLLTSVAALQLVERGKLKLDEPAAGIDPTLGRFRFSMVSMRREPRNCAPRESPLRYAIYSRTLRGSAISFGIRMSFATARRRATIRRCLVRR